MGTSRAKRAQVAERRRRAIELRIQGHTWDEIADRLGYRSKAQACNDVTRALQQNTRDLNLAVDKLRALELARLDRLQQIAWEVLERPHVAVSHGRVVTVKTADGREVRLPDDGPKLAAIDRLLKIADRRAKLLGLDAAEDPSRLSAVDRWLAGVTGVDPAEVAAATPDDPDPGPDSAGDVDGGGGT